jgi:hypothetical protein
MWDVYLCCLSKLFGDCCIGGPLLVSCCRGLSVEAAVMQQCSAADGCALHQLVLSRNLFLSRRYGYSILYTR